MKFLTNKHQNLFEIHPNGKLKNELLLNSSGGLKVAFFHLLFGFAKTIIKNNKNAFNLKYSKIRELLIQKGFNGISDQYISKLMKLAIKNELIYRSQKNNSNYWIISISQKLKNWLITISKRKLLWDLQNLQQVESDNPNNSNPLLDFFKNACRFFKKSCFNKLKTKIPKNVLITPLLTTSFSRPPEKQKQEQDYDYYDLSFLDKTD